MKKNISLIILVTLLFSCKKNESANNETQKVIDKVWLVPQKLLFSALDTIKFSVRYFKNYDQSDVLVFKYGSQIITPSKYYKEEITGENYIYKIPPPHNNGDVISELTISNNQNSTAIKKTIRVIPDFKLETIWKNLDKDYLVNTLSLKNPPFASFEDLDDYQFRSRLNSSFEGIDLNEKPLVFIEGFNGVYTASYNKNKVLTKITILEDFRYDVVEMTSKIYFDKLSKIYGPIKGVQYIGNYVISNLETTNLNIVVKRYGLEFTTEITSK